MARGLPLRSCVYRPLMSPILRSTQVGNLTARATAVLRLTIIGVSQQLRSCVHFIRHKSTLIKRNSEPRSIRFQPWEETVLYAAGQANVLTESEVLALSELAKHLAGSLPSVRDTTQQLSAVDKCTPVLVTYMPYSQYSDGS
jgi:DNA-binding CsgD family transcriptional regulator